MITKISIEMLHYLYDEYISYRMPTSFELIERFKNEISTGEYIASLNYLKDLEYIDFIWILGDIDGYQKIHIKKITPLGIIKMELKSK